MATHINSSHNTLPSYPALQLFPYQLLLAIIPIDKRYHVQHIIFLQTDLINCNRALVG